MPKVEKQGRKGVLGRAHGSPATGLATGRLRSAWDLTEGIKLLLYGKSGTGKTTLWSSFPGPILALICSGGSRPGELRSINTPELREKVFPYILERSGDVRDLLDEAGNYATVVLDHATGLQDKILAELLGLEQLPAQKSWGLATQQQYGQMAQQWKDLVRMLLSLPQNVVLTAHEREFNNEGNSEILAPFVAAALTPSLIGWVNGACDYIGNTYIRPKEEISTTKVAGKDIETRKRLKGRVEYVLRTLPDPTYTTKFRVPKGTPLADIVDPDYTKILAMISGEGAEGTSLG